MKDLFQRNGTRRDALRFGGLASGGRKATPRSLRLRVSLFLISACGLFSLASSARAQVCNTNNIPNPWVDITCPGIGGVGDAVTNPSGGVSAKMLTLADTASLPSFASTDVNKSISIAGAGLGRSAQSTPTTSCTGGNLANGTYYLEVAQFTVSTAGLVTSEGPASSETTLMGLQSCSPGTTGSITIPAPTNLSPAVGWNAYLATASGAETLQSVFNISTNTASTAAVCATVVSPSHFGCDKSTSILIKTLQVDGPPPFSVGSLAVPASPAFTVGTGGSLSASTTYYFKIACVTESGGANSVTNLGGATLEVAPMTNTGSNNQSITITHPGSATCPTGWVVYFSGTQGEEALQPLSTTSGSPAVCATLPAGQIGCPTGTDIVINASTQTSGAAPHEGFGAFQTTIKTFTSATNVTLTDGVVNNTGGSVTWGTDNAAAFASALGKCAASGFTPTTTKGCTIFFPAPLPSSTPPTTGRYYTSKGLTVAQDNIVLEGGGSGGASGIGGTTVASNARPSAEIVCASRTYCLTVNSTTMGLPNAITNGFEMRRLGVEDMSGMNGRNSGGYAWGGLNLTNAVNFYLERVFATDFSAGACIFGEGSTGGSIAQVGTIFDAAGVGCLHGIWFPQSVSAINITNGNFAGDGLGSQALDPSSIGLYVASAPGSGTSSIPTSGNVRVSGTQFRDFFTHVKFFDCGGCTAWDTKNEDIDFPTQPSQVGYVFDGTPSPNGHCAQNAVGYSTITNIGASSGTGINITVNCTGSLVLYPLISGTATPVTNADTTGTVLTNSGIQLASGASLTGSTVQIPSGPSLVSAGLQLASGTNSVAQNFTAGSIASANDVVCINGSNTVADCAGSSTKFVGIALGTTTPVAVQLAGTASVLLDATQNVTAGNFVCSSTTGGKGHYNGGTACTTNRQIGLIAQSATSVSMALVFLQKQ